MNTFLNFSIKRKLIFIIVTITLFVTLISQMAGAFIETNSLKQEIKNNGVLNAKLISEYVKVALDFEDPVWAEHVLKKLASIPDIEMGRVYKKDLTLFSEYSTESSVAQQHPTRDFIERNLKSGHIENSELIIIEPVMQEDEQIGTVVLHIKMNRLYERIRGIVITAIITTVIVIIVSYFLAFRIQSVISGPITRLAETARKMSDNHEYQFTITTPYNDEVGILYNEFSYLIQKVEERDHELRRIQSYLNNVIDSMPSILIGINKDGIITSINRAAEKYVQVKRDDAIGKSIHDLFRGYSKYIDEIKATIENRRPIMKTKIDDSISEKTRLVDLTAYPLIANGIEGAVIRIDDVTDRVRLEEMMVQTEKMMSIGGLAAGMAHEINNPLGIIAQGAQNIVQKTKPDLKANIRVAEECGLTMESLKSYFEKRHIFEFITDIRNAAERAASIVGNILNFSRKSENLQSSCSIPTLIDRTVELVATDFDLKRKYDFKSIRIIKEYDENIPLITICETEIEQVLINLLKNGAQAMSEVTDRDHIFRIRVTADDEWITTEIHDNGPGIPEKVRTRIFEPFYTTKPVGVGTGLGLSVSYMIVHNNHNGELLVDSVPDKGSTFIMKLPIRFEE